MNRLINLFIVLLFLQACKQEAGQGINSPAIVAAPLADTIAVHEKKGIWDVVMIEQVDSATYYTARLKTPPLPEKYKAITDRKVVSQLLKGIVLLGDYDRETEKLVPSDTGWVVMDIRPRRGGRISDYNRDESIFTAYYPDLDILLCEGGHTTDMTFNLTTGETRESTGNPETFVTSPDKSMRLSAVFDGQECSSFYLHYNEGGTYRKVIQLEEVFDKRIGDFALCKVGDAFWADSRTLYVQNPEGHMDNNLTTAYYRVKLGRK